MLGMNRHFASGGIGSCRFSGLAPATHGLRHWGHVCVSSGGVGQILNAIPDGYGVENALYPPILDGAMSAYAYDLASLSGTSSLLSGGPVTADTTSVLTLTVDDASLGLNVLMVGGDTFELAAGTPNLAMTIGLAAEYTVTFDFDTSVLAIIDPISGSFTASLVGEADLRGLLTMEGSFGGADPLTPAGFWSYLLEGDYSAADIMRINAAALAGKTSGQATSPVFRSIDDTANRIAATVSASGNRTAVTLNP